MQNGDLIAHATNNSNIVAYMYLDRVVNIINALTLEIICTVKIKGSGAIISMGIFDNTVSLN